MQQMTAIEAADKLGIAEENRDAFILLVGRMQTPTAHEAELERLRDELAAVNEELHKAGIDYPGGARGVRDLAAFCEIAKDDA